MRKSFVLFAVFFMIFLIAHNIYAQERVSPEDLLRWLPDQAYRHIEFTDFTAMSKAAVWNGMQTPYYARDTGNWFIEDMTAKLMAVPLDIKWRGDKAPPTYGDMGLAEEMILEESAEVLKGYELAYREMQIALFEDADTVIRQAVEIGVLTPHEESYRGFDLYQMSRPVTYEKTGQWIVTAADSHVVLFAASVKQIQQLLDTNGQIDVSVLKSGHLDDLVERIDDLGQHWSFNAVGITLAELESSIAKNNNWDGDELKRVLEKQRYTRRCVISSDVYDEQWHTLRYYVFDPEIELQNSADAQKLAPLELGADDQLSPMPPEMEFSVRIEGNTIIHSYRRDTYMRQQWQRIMDMRSKTQILKKKDSQR